MHRLHIMILATALLVTTSARAHGDAPHGNASIATDQHAFGMQGDPKAATRTIAVTMDDTMRFVPSALEVKQGETVTLVIRNRGKVMHELVLGTPADLAQHAEEMRKHPGMEHDEPFMAHVKPGATQRLTWRFTQAGTFAFACLVPGHFEAGMKGVVAVAGSDGPAGPATATPATTTPSAITTMTAGEVRKVDTATGKVTLRHGEIPNLEMAPMTMVFGVADPAALHALKVGDRVMFSAERRGGAIVITHIEAVK